MIDLPDPRAKSRPGDQHILVIEDNDEGRDALGQLLQLSGHSVQLAENGEKGLQLALRYPPAVAFIDISLPGLNGYEVARRLRSAPTSHKVYLVAMTGYTDPEDQRRAEQAGFDRYLVKPVDPQILLDLVDSLRSRSSV